MAEFNTKEMKLWVTNSASSDCEVTVAGDTTISWIPFSCITNKEIVEAQLVPKKIIQDAKTKVTVVIWNDDTKTIVRCSPDEPFVSEFGVAMATMKKIYGSRTRFSKFVKNNTYRQDLVNSLKIAHAQDLAKKKDSK